MERSARFIPLVAATSLIAGCFSGPRPDPGSMIRVDGDTQALDLIRRNDSIIIVPKGTPGKIYVSSGEGAAEQAKIQEDGTLIVVGDVASKDKIVVIEFLENGHTRAIYENKK